MSSPVVELSQVVLSHGRGNVLEHVDLSIYPGELVYLIGKTGSGKTTLMRSLYADLNLSGGKGRVSGFQLAGLRRNEIPFLRRKIGIIFQDFQLLTDRSVQENLHFVMKATGWKRKPLMKKRIEEVLDLVGLKDKSSAMPHELSGGEQQRVVIARALLNEPFILLADEPTGNLDPSTSLEILDLLARITEEGTAMLLATHNYKLIEAHPSRILRVEGKAIHEVNPEEILTT